MLKLLCTNCHGRFEINDDRIPWKTTDNWGEHVEYQETWCPYCGRNYKYNYISYYSKLREDLGY